MMLLFFSWTEKEAACDDRESWLDRETSEQCLLVAR